MKSWADVEHLAACQPEFNGGVDIGHLFFGEHPLRRTALKGANVNVAYAQAKRVCARCPVRGRCLSDAMATESTGSRWGVRGGLTPDERDALARRGERAVDAVFDDTEMVG